MTSSPGEHPPRPARSDEASPPRQLMVMLAVLFAAESALYSTLTPLLPHYVHSLGISKFAAGVLLASYSTGLLAGSVVAWVLANRLSVRGMTVLGLGLFAASSLGFGFGQDVYTVSVMRGLQGAAAGGIWVGGMSWLIATAPPARTGSLIGTALGSAVFGSLIGPVFGTAAVAVGPAVAFSVLAVALVGLLAWVMTIEPPSNARTAGTSRAPLQGLRDGRMRLALGILGLSAALIAAVMAVVPLRLSDLGVPQAVIGATFAAFAGVAAVGAPVVGRLCDRHEPLRIVRGGLLFACALSVALGLASSAVLLIGLTTFGIGLSLNGLSVPAGTLLTQSVERTGLAVGATAALMNLAFAIGETVGAPAVSALNQTTSQLVPFLLLAGLLLATVGAVRVPISSLASSPTS